MTAAFLVSGVVLGLSAGLSPGPMLTLVIFQTLRYGGKEGVKVALAPLLTDAPIVVFSLIVLARISTMKMVLGALSVFGSMYLFYLACESLRFKGAELGEEVTNPGSLKKGILVNFLNPSPYMFWFSIGGPLVLKAWQAHFAAPFLFIAPFYILLVGSKCTVAILTGHSRGFLKSRHYVLAMRFLGCMLIVFAMLYFINGIKYFGIGLN